MLRQVVVAVIHSHDDFFLCPVYELVTHQYQVGELVQTRLCTPSKDSNGIRVNEDPPEF